MKKEIHRLKSKHLNEDFEFAIYGEGPIPIVAFPCSQGRYFDYENFGMLDIYRPYLENKKITLIAVDSRDSASWFNEKKDHQMGLAHQNYERAIIEEVLPFITQKRKLKKKFTTTGNSWGAYHATNFHLKYPDVFQGSISLSGAYGLFSVIGNYYDESVFYNDMTKYLPGLTDQKYLNPLKKGFFIISHGTGCWEEHQHEARFIAENLREKNIPHLYDPWGPNWNHDWPTWKAQIPKFLDIILLKYD